MVRSLVWKSFALALVLAPLPALAQEADVPPDAEAPAAQPQPAATEPANSDSGFKLGAPGSSGFQLSLRLGAAIPAGTHDNVGGGDLKSNYGTQFALNLDVGGKASKYVFIGAFLGADFGGPADGIAQCGTAGISCSVKTFRIGPEVQVSILPDALVNPWIGVGIGFEYTSFQESALGQSASVASYGPEFAHIMAGADFRLNRWIGGGPFLDVAISEYTTETITQPDGTSLTQEIPQKSTHEWIQVGFRFVLFP